MAYNIKYTALGKTDELIVDALEKKSIEAKLAEQFAESIAEIIWSDDFLPEPRPNGLSGRELLNTLYEDVRQFIRNQVNQVKILNVETNDIVFWDELAQINVEKILLGIVDWHETCEQSSFNHVALIVRSVEHFMDEGTWHYGLVDDNLNVITDMTEWPNPQEVDGKVVWRDSFMEYEPIIWFGFDKPSIVGCLIRSSLVTDELPECVI